jgi:hypothetical protein
MLTACLQHLGQGIHKYRHATPQAQHQVQGALLLDVVVAQGAPVLQLVARNGEALLVREDALLVDALLVDYLLVDAPPPCRTPWVRGTRRRSPR